MLEIKNVFKKLGKNRVLKNLSLNINHGEIFGLVGVNGAGKSTLLRAIAGVYELDRGEILFNGQNTWNNETIRKQILYISDDPYYSKMTTIESMRAYYETFYDFDEVAYYKYLNMFHLDPNVPIENFSKGMKRQAYLVFALAIKPKLLLLDEAFDGLDPLVRYYFRKALVDLITENEITVIISSHNLKELEDICDSFGILENGQIKTSGDLKASKDKVNKYQLVFEEEKDIDIFKDLDIMYASASARVIILVIRGEQEEVLEQLQTYQPLVVDVLPVDFEEMFIYEIESRGALNE